LARFSVTPTPPLPSPLCASPPFTAPDGSYAYYPQLKFFELAGHDLVRFFSFFSFRTEAVSSLYQSL
jgi:hypothetical protein